MFLNKRSEAGSRAYPQSRERLESGGAHAEGLNGICHRRFIISLGDEQHRTVSLRNSEDGRLLAVQRVHRGRHGDGSQVAFAIIEEDAQHA